MVVTGRGLFRFATGNSKPPKGLELDGDAAALRARRLRYAITASLLSKVTTAGVQLIAMPVALVSLGAHGFSLLAMLTAAVGWLALSNVGFGPALVVNLAAAHATNDFEKEDGIFSSAFIPVLAISTVVSSFAGLGIALAPIDSIFGPLYTPDAHTIRWGLIALVAVFFLQTNMSTFESAQAGYQEQYIYGLNATVSSIPCIVGVIIVAKYFPSPIGVLLAMNIPVVVFRFINSLFVMGKHPRTIPSLRAFRWRICKKLARGGATFSLAGSAGNLLSHVLPVILVGRVFSADITASFAATMSAIVLASGVVSMLCTPLWPAIADSETRGDRGWARSSYHRLVWFVMVFGLFFAVFLALKGPWLFGVWFQGRINPSRGLLAAAGLYFVALCWEASHFTILVGLRRITVASMLVFARSALGALAMIIGLRSRNEATPYIAMFLAVMLVDAIPLRRLVHGRLSYIKKG